ncbi:MAG: IS30 family transposase [Bifidobacteriaceae bacterium]|nr:IS30 family transposase [Bifidobacteriaceae bacterium]
MDERVQIEKHIDAGVSMRGIAGQVDYVVKALGKGWTPQSISGRLARDHAGDPSKQVSPETLYAWIYSPAQKHRRLWEYFPRGRKKRRKHSGRRVHSSKIDRRVSIRHRPAGCQERTEFGHWEGDSVIGARGGAALHTEVERTTRHLQVRKVGAVTCEQAVKAQTGIFAALAALVERQSELLVPVSATNRTRVAATLAQLLTPFEQPAARPAHAASGSNQLRKRPQMLPNTAW